MGGAEGSEGLEGKGQQLPDHAKKRASELSSEGQAGCFERFYLFIFRQRGREGEREGEEHQHCGCLSHTPHLGPGLQLRHVP